MTVIDPEMKPLTGDLAPLDPWLNNEVTDKQSAEAFYIDCIAAIGDGFDPDDSMYLYVDLETDQPLFSDLQAEALAKNSDRAYDLCNAYETCAAARRGASGYGE